MLTKKQRQREQLAQLCASIGGDNSQVVKQLRATNRRVEKRKRAQKRQAAERGGVMSGDLYKRVDERAFTEKCPVCGADGEIWGYSEDFANGPVQKVVMCSNGTPIGPQEGIVAEGCLLFMPPPDFYQPTIREAVKFWNEFAKALTEQRARRNGWHPLEVEGQAADK